MVTALPGPQGGAGDAGPDDRLLLRDPGPHALTLGTAEVVGTVQAWVATSIRRRTPSTIAGRSWVLRLHRGSPNWSRHAVRTRALASDTHEPDHGPGRLRPILTARSGYFGRFPGPRDQGPLSGSPRLRPARRSVGSARGSAPVATAAQQGRMTASDGPGQEPISRSLPGMDGRPRTRWGLLENRRVARSRGFESHPLRQRSRSL